MGIGLPDGVRYAFEGHKKIIDHVSYFFSFSSLLVRRKWLNANVVVVVSMYTCEVCIVLFVVRPDAKEWTSTVLD